MKTELFQSCGHFWVFQISWHTEYSTFTASSFRIWNSSTGVPSPPLALFIVMLPKAHFTLHSRMSGSRWVTIPPSLSGSWRSFLHSSSVYSYYLFLVSSAHTISVLHCAHLCMESSLDISNFLEEIPSFPFYCFPLFLCIDHWGRLSYLSLLFFGILHSDEYIFLFLLCLSLLFFSQLFVRFPQTTILPFCISFSWGWSWSPTLVQCHSSSGTLSIRSNPLDLFVTSTI